jgi:hypothetical protein
MSSYGRLTKCKCFIIYIILIGIVNIFEGENSLTIPVEELKKKEITKHQGRNRFVNTLS